MLNNKYLIDTLKNEDAFWDKLIPYCEAGVKDVANVRDNALWLLALIQVERHDLAFPITKAMGEHLKARYESDYRNQRPDFNRNKSKLAEKNSNKTNSNDNNDDNKSSETTKIDSTNDEKEEEIPQKRPAMNSHMRKVKYLVDLIDLIDLIDLVLID